MVGTEQIKSKMKYKMRILIKKIKQGYMIGIKGSFGRDRQGDERRHF